VFSPVSKTDLSLLHSTFGISLFFFSRTGAVGRGYCQKFFVLVVLEVLFYLYSVLTFLDVRPFSGRPDVLFLFHYSPGSSDDAFMSFACI